MLKTIQINPDLFKTSKTRKSRASTPKPILPPPRIDDDVLRLRLERKMRERKKAELAEIAARSKENSYTAASADNDMPDLDEFNKSFDYLNHASEKLNYEKAQRRKREELQRRTLRAQPVAAAQLPVHLELPECMRADIEPIHTDLSNTETTGLTYQVDHDIPYGCMRGGRKPCVRGTRRHIAESPSGTDKVLRSARLEAITAKIQNMQRLEAEMAAKLAPPTTAPPTPPVEPVAVVASNKRITRRTIRRKYTLGRNKNKVGVLIQSGKTRKQINDAHTALKYTDIDTVKKYLRLHGLNRAGSQAPTDILRKTYEDAVMTGDVTNSNTGMLIHNFFTPDADEAAAAADSS